MGYLANYSARQKRLAADEQRRYEAARMYFIADLRLNRMGNWATARYWVAMSQLAWSSRRASPLARYASRGSAVMSGANPVTKIL